MIKQPRQTRRLLWRVVWAVVFLWCARLSSADINPPASESSRISLAAKRVSGVVVAEMDSSAITEVNVSVDRLGVSTRSGYDGSFTLAGLPSGSHLVRFSHVGFETVTVTATVPTSRVDTLFVVLKKRPLVIDPITITPGELALEEYRPNIERRFSYQQMASVPQLGEDVFRAVARTPGVSAGDYGARFSVRGSEYDEVLVELDGMELYEPYHLKDVAGGAVSAIDQATLESVILRPSAFNARYGDRLSGVFTLSTRTPAQDQHSYAAGLSLTAARLLSEGRFSNNRGAWMFSARRGYADLILGFTREYRDVSPRYYDLFGKFLYRLSPAHQLSLHVLYGRDDLDYQYQTRNDEPETHLANNDYNSSYAWLTLHSFPSAAITVQTIVSAVWLNHDRFGRSPLVDDYLNYRIWDDRQFSGWGLKQEWQVAVSQRSLSTFGFDLKREHARYEYDGTSQYYFLIQHYGWQLATDRHVDSLSRNAGRVALYASTRYRCFDWLMTEAGIRYDRMSHTEDRLLSPRLSATLSLGEATTVRASVGRYTQSQRLYELRVSDRETHFAPSEIASVVILGLDHRIGEQLRVQIEAYRRRIDNPRPMYRNWYQDMHAFAEGNRDRIKVTRDWVNSKGIELSIRNQGSGWINWWLSYALSRTTEYVESVTFDRIIQTLNEEIPGPYDQRHTIQTHVDLRPSATWSVSLTWLYRTGWHYTPAVLNLNVPLPAVSPNAFNGSRLSPYHRLDVRASRYLPTSIGRFTFFAEVINLYNRYNVRAYSYDVMCSGEDCYLQQEQWPWLRLTPSIGFTWDLEI